MEWTKFQSAEFSLDQPAGWLVRTSPGPVATVTSPDGQAFALIEAFAVSAGDTPTAILEQLRFPTSRLFPEARPEKVIAGPANSANVFLNYRMPNGAIGRARVACVPAGNKAMIFTTAALEAQFAAYEPTLVRIVMSFRPASLVTPPPIPRPAAMASLQYARFTDPQMGTFSARSRL